MHLLYCCSMLLVQIQDRNLQTLMIQSIAFNALRLRSNQRADLRIAYLFTIRARFVYFRNYMTSLAFFCRCGVRDVGNVMSALILD